MLYDPRWEPKPETAKPRVIAPPGGFALAPIEWDFVLYSRRPLTKNNVGLFVDGGVRRYACVCR